LKELVQSLVDELQEHYLETSRKIS
jgi:hypothetical protein